MYLSISPLRCWSLRRRKSTPMAFGGRPLWRQPGNRRDSNKCRFRSARLSSAPRANYFRPPACPPQRCTQGSQVGQFVCAGVQLPVRPKRNSLIHRRNRFMEKFKFPVCFGADAERRLSHPWRHPTNPNHYLPGHHDPWPLRSGQRAIRACSIRTVPGRQQRDSRLHALRRLYR
jgi:hypothetical protein